MTPRNLAPRHYCHGDPGLQPERTSLAWTRTAISLTIVSMILLRWSHEFGYAIFGVIGTVLSSAIIVSHTQRQRYDNDVRGLIDNAVRPNTFSVILLGSTAVALGLASIILVLNASP